MIKVDLIVWRSVSQTGHKWLLNLFNNIQYRASIQFVQKGIFGWTYRNDALVHFASQYMFSKYLPKVHRNLKIITVHDLCHMKDLENLVYADAITVISQATKNALLETFPQIDPKIVHLIYNTIDTSYFKPISVSKDPEVKYIISVGTEQPRKNLDVVIKSLKYLPKNVKFLKIGPTRLNIPSAQKQRNHLISLAKEYSVEDRIVWVGNVTNYELLYYYNLADVCILPSYCEGFGMSALESMAAGTPIIGSNLTSVPEVIGNAGLIFDPDNENELADKINQVLSDNDLSQSLHSKGLERAQFFDPKTESDKLFSLYSSLYENYEYKNASGHSKIRAFP